MKIGIVSFPLAYNYGAFLQAYALQNVIKDLDVVDEVEHIRYKSLGNTIKELAIVLGSRTQARNGISKLALLRKVYNFKSAFRQLKLSTHPYFLKNGLSKYDKLIYGSDEIWNLNNDVVKDHLFYYGKPFKGLKISYAPSFGSTIIDDIVDTVYERELKTFNHVSARDENSDKILKSIGINDISLVLDPTLLFDFSPLIKEPSVMDYILIYGFGDFNNSMKDAILKFAQKRGKKIVSIGYGYNWTDQNYVDIDPFEWLGFFKNASYIITNSFHGTIFSIIFQKKFVRISHKKGLDDKVTFFLKQLNLTDRVISENEILKLDEGIDYSAIQIVLKQLKENSMNYLSNSIRG